MVPQVSLTKVGRYQIIGELGHGAMGVVYRGFDPTIGRTVAVKTVLLDTGDPEMVRRFRREAQAAGILSHPNIVTIYDAGEDNGLFYIAMELVEGDTLQQLLLRGALPVDRVISIVEQVGAALDHAHSKQIIHRDIKPANIMVSNNVAKVMDFGVAKMTAMGLTSTGQVLGTPSYMSPELVKGANVDGRSDIFSLGVVLYEMLTGAKPFTGDSITTVIYKIIGEEPDPPAMLNSSLHSGLNYVVLKSLAKNPVDRYQNCAELIADLKNFQALGEKGQMAARAAAAAQASVPRETTGTLTINRRDLGLPELKKPGAGVSGTRQTWAIGALAAVVLAAVAFWLLRPGSSSDAGLMPERVVVDSQPAPVTAPAPGVATQPAGPKPSPFGGTTAAIPAASKAPDAAAPTTHPGNGASSPVALTVPASATPGSIPQPQLPTAKPPQPSDAARPGGTGRVSLHSAPRGARVFIDGRETSYRTPVNIELPAGKHLISVVQPGFGASTREVNVRRDRVEQVELKLQKGGGENAEAGKKRRGFFSRFR